MNEIVEAINNLNKFSFMDIIPPLMSAIPPSILSFILYKQNQRFNKENNDLNKKINNIENKRILYRNILDIYNSYETVKIHMNGFKSDNNLFKILINNQNTFNYMNNIFNLKNAIQFSLIQARIIFKNKKDMLNSLEHIDEKCNLFLNKVENYFLYNYYNEYANAMKNVCKIKEINILQNGQKIFGLNNNINSCNLEISLAINNIDIINEFIKQYDRENIDKLISLADEIYNYFTQENFYKYFEEYLTIDNMEV